MTERPAPSEAEALVERLRQAHPDDEVGTLGDEAASLVERQAEDLRTEKDQHLKTTNTMVATNRDRDNEIRSLRAEVERLQEQVRPTKPCDLFQNGSDEPCGGPQFSDPQTEGVDLRVCAFHALMNRNYWMTDARTAHARLDLAMRVVEAARKRCNCGRCDFGVKDLDAALAALDAGTTPPRTAYEETWTCGGCGDTFTTNKRIESVSRCHCGSPSEAWRRA